MVPSANYSSDNRNKAQESDRNWRSERRSCFACGSNKHFLRDCNLKDEYYDRQRNQQHEEVSYKKSGKRSDSSPHLKSILRRKTDDVGSSKTKHSKNFISADGDWNSDEN